MMVSSINCTVSLEEAEITMIYVNHVSMASSDGIIASTIETQHDFVTVNGFWPGMTCAFRRAAVW
jgi:hypothetical protein